MIRGQARHANAPTPLALNAPTYAYRLHAPVPRHVVCLLSALDLFFWVLNELDLHRGPLQAGSALIVVDNCNSKHLH